MSWSRPSDYPTARQLAAVWPAAHPADVAAARAATARVAAAAAAAAADPPGEVEGPLASQTAGNSAPWGPFYDAEAALQSARHVRIVAEADRASALSELEVVLRAVTEAQTTFDQAESTLSNAQNVETRLERLVEYLRALVATTRVPPSN